jgi:hypothetical protein
MAVKSDHETKECEKIKPAGMKFIRRTAGHPHTGLQAYKNSKFVFDKHFKTHQI